MRYLVLFFMIMGLRGDLFAQVATPMYGITREAMQIPVKHDTMILLGAGDFVAVDTMPLTGTPGAVKRDLVTCDSMVYPAWVDSIHTSDWRRIKMPIDTGTLLFIHREGDNSRVLPVLEYGHPYHGPQYRILTIHSGPPTHLRYNGPTPYYNPEEHIPKLEVISANALEFNTNAVPFRWGLGFISGAARGLNQTIAFHPDRFFARYPDANRRYWDNSVSWQNKWRNGAPQQGEAFLGSSTVFVWTTDALHLSGTISNVAGVASLSIPIYKGCGKMNIWKHLAQVGITSAGYWLGFHSAYSWWFQ